MLGIFLVALIRKILSFDRRQQKNRMSHDNRFSKTNYLKTNLLKQIKKISLFWFTPVIFLLFTLQNYKKSK